jgi:glutaminase
MAARRLLVRVPVAVDLEGFHLRARVSGGILVAVPSHFRSAFFSPGLDQNGNSVRGINICRDLSSRFGLHAYADPDEALFGRIEALDPEARGPLRPRR